ncbi:hypothetical protein [Candidatus Bandiella euplotis]|uniref:Ankyrin repeat domain-containing protein n=1 Tax=Candidatus Bandiella euplotis TaxID=1664265 RepID=A0ABZ0UNM9_9RICK|nr:hypothetical protein [Candidatus Bandiella woodruffii]WPX97324.1 Putative ankyrin repeat domain-containing protein [Candidatus Bandiella woodruffii]
MPKKYKTQSPPPIPLKPSVLKEEVGTGESKILQTPIEKERENELRKKFADIRNGNKATIPYFTPQEQVVLNNMLQRGDASILQSEKAKENYTWRESITQFFYKLVGIEYKAMDINALDKNGKRPWEYLLHSGKALNLARLQGVDIESHNDDGKNMVHRLVQQTNDQNKEESLKIIKTFGRGGMFLADDYGITPFDLAKNQAATMPLGKEVLDTLVTSTIKPLKKGEVATKETIDVISRVGISYFLDSPKIFVSAVNNGADLRHQDHEGKNVLHKLFEQFYPKDMANRQMLETLVGHEDFRLLLKQKDFEGKTPLDIAKASYNAEELIPQLEKSQQSTTTTKDRSNTAKSWVDNIEAKEAKALGAKLNR